MKRFWPLAFLLSSLAWGEDLFQIYRLALENDPTFRAARAALKAGLEEEKLGLSELLPKVELTAGYSQSFIQGRGQFPAGGLLLPNRTDRGIEAKRWAVSLQQPILDLEAWFRFRRGVKLSEEARARFAAASQDLILRVAEAYLAVLRARADLEASRALEEANQRQLEQAKARLELGLADLTDVREAEAAYGLARAQRIAAEGALEVAREKLTILTGQRHEILEVLREDYPVTDPEPRDLQHWIDFAKANNYDLQAARLAMEVALQQARAAAAGHLPKITLQLSYEQSRSDIDFHNLAPRQGGDRYAEFPSNVDQGSFSLTFTMPLFAGGGISAHRRKAYAEYERAKERYLGVLRQTVQDTRAAFLNVVTHAARVRAQKQAVASSRTSLEATKAGYEVGTRTIVDVLTAIQNYHRAMRDYEEARIDYILATLRLKRLAGTLSPADLEAIDHFLEPPKPSIIHPSECGRQVCP